MYMSIIIDNKLFLGCEFDANNETMLKENNITCIICVADNLIIRLNDPNIKVYKYNLQDDYECNISLYFDEIGDIINNEKIVLVNCLAGISRSSTIVIAYLMKYHHFKLKDAFLYVKSKRNQICPNKQFMDYLLDYEMQLFGINIMTYEECRRLFFYT